MTDSANPGATSGASPEANPWRVLQEEVTFSCSWFDVRQDLVSHSGQPSRAYHSIRMKQAGVCVLPVDQDGQVTLVGQYRYVVGRYTWELPGGGARLGVDPLEVAKQELREECGYRAGRWRRLIGGDVSPGTLDSRGFGYLAWDLEQGEPQPEPEESLSLRQVPFAKAVAMALGGEIGNLISQTLLLAAQVRLSQGSLPGELAQRLR
jgi:8-oxo-dGTP pyrophosphatase MutT (NUDIX family)